MGALSIREIYEAARSAGFNPHEAVTWTSIALAESGGNPKALNNHGEYSVGLWQVNVRSGVRSNKWGDLTDPKINAKAAFEISQGGTDIRPWTTTHDNNKGTSHDFRTYIHNVEKIVGVEGDDRGVHGYGSPKLKPLHFSKTYDEIDSGRSLDGAGSGDGHDHSAEADGAEPTGGGAAGKPAAAPTSDQTDTDGDGLTDQFEKLAGTNPRLADTDSDGLSDGYEAMVSHTDPLAADTDHDGFSDAYELGHGTDAGRIVGNAGVVGKGKLAENVRNGIVDTDHDGLSDTVEKNLGTNARVADTDHDQINDGEEVALGTNARVADTDHDGVVDGVELKYGADPLTGLAAATQTTAPGMTPAWTMEGAAAKLDAAKAAVARAEAAKAATDPDDAAGTPTSTTDTAAADGADAGSGSSKLDTFLTMAKAQSGDRYVYGATPKLSAKDPTAFDCSSFTQWAANKAGVHLERTAEYQYMQLKSQHLNVSVEQAMKTPGALLFYFSHEPSSSLPEGQAHVAISLGDGKTIEAKGSRYGVGEFTSKNRFNYAAVIPGISDPKGLKAYHEAHDLTSTPTGHAGTGTAHAASSDDTSGGTATLLATKPTTAESDAFAIDSGHPLARISSLPGAKTVDLDSDHDGLTDAFEKLAGTNLHSRDTDRDGLSDSYEAMVSHTDPLAADTDHDGFSDSYEWGHHTDAGHLAGRAGVVGSGRFAENVRKGFKDADHDGLSDRTERLIGTNAKLADTDRDGINDGEEASLGTDPTNSDTDHDGVSDGLELEYKTNPLDATSTFGASAGAGAGQAGAGQAGLVGAGQPGLVGAGQAGLVGAGQPGLFGAGQPGLAGAGQPGLVTANQQVIAAQQALAAAQQVLAAQQALAAQQGLTGQPGVVGAGQPGMVGQPGVVGQPGLVSQPTLGAQAFTGQNPLYQAPGPYDAYPNPLYAGPGGANGLAAAAVSGTNGIGAGDTLGQGIGDTFGQGIGSGEVDVTGGDNHLIGAGLDSNGSGDLGDFGG